MIKQKFRELLQPEFPLKTRLFLSLMIGFALSFTLFLFGILDIFFSNSTEMLTQIRYSEVLLIALGTFFVVWAGLSGILLLSPGKCFSALATVAAGILAAGYLQGTFLNPDLGALTGDAIRWDFLMGHTLLNVGFWILVIALLLIVRFLSKQVWKRTVAVLCVLLVGMQGAALTGSMMTSGAEFSRYDSLEGILSLDGAYELSSQNNILIFTLDRLDFEYIEQVRKDDPAFFDRLDGFTEFTNATSYFSHTFPSIAYMTTGIKDFCGEESVADFLDRAWDSSSFIPYLQDNNYVTKYHIEFPSFASVRSLEGKADNITANDSKLARRDAVEKFLKLSAFRYAPLSLKPSFWLPEASFKRARDNSAGYIETNDDTVFFRHLNQNGLTVQNEKSNYFFCHLLGSHAPYFIDEFANDIQESDVVRQTKGSFHILYTYMDEMKRLGLYENATIIITGDHGIDQYDDYAGDFDDYPWELVSMTIGLFVKPKGSAGTPLVQNNAPVSHENLLATILQSEGLDYAPYGESVFDVPEDADVVRSFVYYPWIKKHRYPAYFSIIGDAKEWDSWWFNGMGLELD